MGRDPSALLARYDAMADRAAAQVVRSYSSSFGAATALLAPSVRRDVRNLYAVVRIADEIVDGTGAQGNARLSEVDRHATVAELLDTYERQIRAASATRFHHDPIVHAFAGSARRCEFRDEHLAAFFESMRCDLQKSMHSQESLEDYIYGSAEVIGLLCLHCFFGPERNLISQARWSRLEMGARSLGSAFQKVNFLRDLREDLGVLGRVYFPSCAVESGKKAAECLSEEEKLRLVAGIEAELAVAYACMGELPLQARAGVVAAADLFSELNRRVAVTPVAELLCRRVRVPAHRKSAIITRAVAKASLMTATKEAQP